MTKRTIWILAAMGLGNLLVSMLNSLTSIALPTIVKELNTTVMTAQWLSVLPILVITTLTLSVGALGDRYGKRRIFLWGLILYALGSLISIFTRDIYVLIILRILVAIGATMEVSMTMAIATECTSEEYRGRAMGIVSIFMVSGFVIGPIFGGWLMKMWGWTAIFLGPLPLVGLAYLLTILFVPNDEGHKAGKFDLIGSLILFFGLLSFLLALTLGPVIGFRQWQVLALFASAVVCITGFFSYEHHQEHPLLDFSALKNIKLSINLAVRFICSFMIMGLFLVIPFYLQNLIEVDVALMGIAMAIGPLGEMCVIQFFGRAADRHGAQKVVSLGLAAQCIGYLLLIFLNLNQNAWAYVLLSFPLNLALGIFVAPNSSQVMSAMPQEKLGVASGLFNLIEKLGSSLGMVLVNAFWLVRVRGYSTGTVITDVSMASKPATMQGLTDTFWFAVALIAIALVISVVGNRVMVRDTETREVSSVV